MIERSEVKSWFCREVLPLEHVLTAFLRRNWRVREDVLDFRQEVYARVFAAGCQELPTNVRAFVLITARNLLINHARRASIVSFELMADLEDVATDTDELTPERHAVARDELRHVRAAVARLPARCQEIVMLRKVEGMSHREIAARTGLSPRTVEAHLTRGMRGLADMMQEENEPVDPTTARNAGVKVRGS